MLPWLKNIVKPFCSDFLKSTGVFQPTTSAVTDVVHLSLYTIRSLSQAAAPQADLGHLHNSLRYLLLKAVNKGYASLSASVRVLIS
jgi:hypothetical protein